MSGLQPERVIWWTRLYLVRAGFSLNKLEREISYDCTNPVTEFLTILKPSNGLATSRYRGELPGAGDSKTAQTNHTSSRFMITKGIFRNGRPGGLHLEQCLVCIRNWYTYCIEWFRWCGEMSEVRLCQLTTARQGENGSVWPHYPGRILSLWWYSKQQGVQGEQRGEGFGERGKRPRAT